MTGRRPGAVTLEFVPGLFKLGLQALNFEFEIRH
jgi:hypothetical protein